MKICQITDVHPRYDGRIFRKISVSLQKAGYDVTLLCSDGKGDEIKDGVKFIDAGFLPGNRFSRIMRASSALYKKAVEIDADVYHLHDPELLKLGLRLKKRGKKVIFDSHEDVPMQVMAKTYIPKFLRKAISRSVERKEKKALSRFDGVISVTPHIVEKLKKFNANTVMITNYPIFVDIKRETSENKIVCFAGGISSQWKHANVIRAIGNLGGKVRYLLIGKNKGDYFESLKSISGFEYVDAVGEKPYSDVLTYYSAASIGVALNGYVANVDYKNGSIGNTKLFELMMAGLPVVCTDFKLWKEIVEGANAGICVNPDDVDEITNAIAFLADNPEKAQGFGENGKKAVKEKYNWQTQERILLDFYKEL